jgi:hypothetical protein
MSVSSYFEECAKLLKKSAEMHKKYEETIVCEWGDREPGEQSQQLILAAECELWAKIAEDKAAAYRDR